MTTITRLFTLCLVLLVCPAAFAKPAGCPQFFPGGQVPALVNAKLAQRATLLCNDAFAALASGVTHGPLWSAEHPTTASLEAARATPRQGAFHPMTGCRWPTRRSWSITAGPATTGAT